MDDAELRSVLQHERLDLRYYELCRAHPRRPGEKRRADRRTVEAALSGLGVDDAQWLAQERVFRLTEGEAELRFVVRGDGCVEFSFLGLASGGEPVGAPVQVLALELARLAGEPDPRPRYPLPYALDQGALEEVLSFGVGLLGAVARGSRSTP